MENETIESLAAQEAEKLAEEPKAVETPEDPETLRAFGRGIAAEEGWLSPAQAAQLIQQNQPAPTTDTTPKWPGTNQPLPSNFESLDDDTKIAMHEFALSTENQLKSLAENYARSSEDQLAPIMRDIVIAQVAKKLPGITLEAAEEVIKQVEVSAPGTKFTSRLPEATAHLFALAAQQIASTTKKPAKEKGDPGNDPPGFKASQEGASDAEALYEKTYGKKMSAFIKQELGIA